MFEYYSEDDTELCKPNENNNGPHPIQINIYTRTACAGLQNTFYSINVLSTTNSTSIYESIEMLVQ